MGEIQGKKQEQTQDERNRGKGSGMEDLAKNKSGDESGQSGRTHGENSGEPVSWRTHGGFWNGEQRRLRQVSQGKDSRVPLMR